MSLLTTGIVYNLFKVSFSFSSAKDIDICLKHTRTPAITKPGAR
ncbi:MAG: hypothetical protein ACTSXH_14350 [Promethearchaeota archaeon]